MMMISGGKYDRQIMAQNTCSYCQFFARHAGQADIRDEQIHLPLSESAPKPLVASAASWTTCPSAIEQLARIGANQVIVFNEQDA